MNYDRRNPILRSQYALLSHGLYNCQGKDTNCSLYRARKGHNTCIWYETIQNDIKKIKTGGQNITFNLLEKILQNENAKKNNKKIKINSKREKI